MAAFMYRLAGSPTFSPPSNSPFSDMSPSAQFYKEITWLAAKGISTGWTEPDGTRTYRPLQSIARDAMAAFMYRFAGSPDFAPPLVSPFADVAPASQFYKEITWLAAEHISTGWTDPTGATTYRPLNAVARDAMAAFMYRLHHRQVPKPGPSCTPPITHISGTIGSDLTLASSCSPVFEIDSDLTVPSGTKLTVESGVTVQVARDTEVLVQGDLVVNGNPTAPVLFTAAPDRGTTAQSNQNTAELFAPFKSTASPDVGPQEGQWTGIKVAPGGSVTAIDLTIQFADTGLQAQALTVADAPKTTVSLDKTNFAQTNTCLSLQGPVAGHFHGAVKDCVVGVSADFAYNATHVDWAGGDGPGELGKGRPALQGQNVSVFPWSGMSLLPAPKALETPTLPSSDCSDYLFIGVRGSGETATQENNGLGDTVKTIRDAFESEIQPRQPGVRVRTIGLNYPAYGVPIIQQWNKILDYVPGAWQGAVELLEVMEREQQRCAASGERIVLAGYSQGAWAIHTALNYAAASDRVDMSKLAAIGLLGDAQRLAGAKELQLGDAPGFTYGVANTLFLSAPLYGFSDWLAGAVDPAVRGWQLHEDVPLSKIAGVQSIPTAALSATASFCGRMDPVCGLGDAAISIDVHSYSVGTRELIGRWMANKVQNVTACAVEGVIATASSSLSTEYALKSDGTVCAWGMNFHGQLGAGTVGGYSSVPLQVSNLKDVASIVAGGSATYALLNDGTVWSWGDNSYCFLGNGDCGSAQLSAVPVRVAGLSNVKQVTTAGGPTYALKNDGTVWVWGVSFGSLMGNGLQHAAAPVQVNGITDVQSLYVTGSQTFAVKKDGTLWAWGSNTSGSLGIGSTTDTPSPQQVPGLTNVSSVAPNGSSTFALKTDGTVWAWGENGDGQLGNGTTVDSSVPIKVTGLEGVKILKPTEGGAVAVTESSTLWGSVYADHNYKVGVIPFSEASLHGIRHIETGLSMAELAVLGDGTVWVWGANGGQFGNGTLADSSIPVRVDVPGNVKSLSAENGTVLAVTLDGHVYAWGGNDKGQLGTTSEPSPLAPVLVGS
ncbi:cutinase family protein [Paenarthrobacter nicotinovorans]|uniref:RCC1 domain-containing protein n=1 Tax=Paenarthrobacter nicotinovorans TaxID=29320 RepID=UPI00381287A6